MRTRGNERLPVKTGGSKRLLMIEDVKGRGGSSYVVGKDKKVLESWVRGKE